MFNVLGDPTVSARTLEACIDQRTHFRVQDLRVDVAAHEITVYGRVGSYYVLQLALEAAKDMKGGRNA